MALGVDAVVVGRDADGDIAHVELRWPGGGTVVFGATKHTEGTHAGLRPGSAAMYVVTDDVDGVHQLARTAGADVTEPPLETAFGSGARSRVFTVRDPDRGAPLDVRHLSGSSNPIGRRPRIHARIASTHANGSYVFMGRTGAE